MRPRCRGQSIVVIGVFADEIYPAGRAEDARLGIKAPLKVGSQVAQYVCFEWLLAHLCLGRDSFSCSNPVSLIRQTFESPASLKSSSMQNRSSLEPLPASDCRRREVRKQ